MKQSIGLAYSLLELLELSEVLLSFMAAKICWNKDEMKFSFERLSSEKHRIEFALKI